MGDGEPVSDPEYPRRFIEYCEALESIAADTRLPTDQRGAAKEALGDLAEGARETIADALNALASIDAREGSALAHALLKIREAIDDPRTSEDVRQQLLQARQRFYSS